MLEDQQHDVYWLSSIGTHSRFVLAKGSTTRRRLVKRHWQAHMIDILNNIGIDKCERIDNGMCDIARMGSISVERSAMARVPVGVSEWTRLTYMEDRQAHASIGECLGLAYAGRSTHMGKTSARTRWDNSVSRVVSRCGGGSMTLCAY